MKICIISDSHNKVDINKFLVSMKKKADFVIHLGDLNDYKRKAYPIFFVNGNKENFKEMDEAINNKYNNLVHLKSGELKQTMNFKTKKYLRFVGINGIVYNTVWNKSEEITDLESIQHNLKHSYNKFIFKEQLEKIKRIPEKIDIIFSHDIPYTGESNDGLRPFGNFQLSRVLRKVKPKFWLHGHAHKGTLNTCGDTTIIGVPPLYKGYCELTINGDDHYYTQFKNTDKECIKGDTNET